ncbi:MAG TPA: hypothetical protein VH951_10655 [Dehalococcoidia bacterium]|jgi:hypothetical protein
MGTEKRENLSSNLVKSVRTSIPRYATSELSDFKVERSKSAYPQAKEDLVIFDGQGAAVIKGRDFGGGQISLWI